jgi:hypothetical protein
VLEGVLELPMAPDKLFLVGSSGAVAQVAAPFLAPKGFQVKPSLRQLGIEYSGSKKAADNTIADRIQGFAERVGQIRSLNLTRASVGARLVKTGGLPSMLHGVAVNGINNTKLSLATRIAHAAVTRNGNPACPTSSLLLHRTKLIHPWFKAHLDPILAWGKQVYQGRFPVCEVRKAFKHAKAALLKSTAWTWQKVRSPAMAFLATAARIGWKVPSHDRVIDATGCSIDLTTIGGPLVRRKVIRDVQTALWQKLANDRNRTYGENPWDLLAAGVHDRPLLAELNGKSKGVLDQNEIASLSSAMQGREWPQKRRHQAFNEVVTPLCLRCLSAEGTEAHRLVLPVR